MEKQFRLNLKKNKLKFSVTVTLKKDVLDPQGKVVQNTLVNMGMNNLKNILNECNCTFDNIVKCTIFLSNINLFESVNKIYGHYFKEPYPARETVEVARLPKDVNLEISMIAIKD